MSILNSYLLITVLPNLREWFCVLGILGMIVVGVAGAVIFGHINCKTEEEDDVMREKVFKISRKYFLLFTLIGISTCFLPSQKEIAIIYATNFALSNEQVKALPPKVLNVINKYLDDILKDEPKGK